MRRLVNSIIDLVIDIVILLLKLAAVVAIYYVARYIFIVVPSTKLGEITINEFINVCIIIAITLGYFFKLLFNKE